jgi:hypothetical protein
MAAERGGHLLTIRELEEENLCLLKAWKEG